MGRPVTSTKAEPRTRVTEVKARESHRDTVEAIVVAFILALVVRGFEAQAFVIPTGSMAPTLMGRHKEVACPQCGFLYSVNASDEVEGRIDPNDPHARLPEVVSGICVNCRHQARLKESPSFKGDRILVMMFPYDLTSLPGAKPPERWDVVVFRYPEEPEVSYIKRLVGLPGETLRIHHGDVYIRPPGSEDFSLAHKPYKHLRSMMIPVYDDGHQPKALAEQPEWRRWASSSDTSWKMDESSPGRYRVDSTGDSWADLRYRHLVPDPEQWDAILNGRPLPRVPRPTLITDFYAYNTNMTSAPGNLVSDPASDRNAWLQPHWVGDLMLSATVDVESKSGLIRLELVKGGVPHRCMIDIETGYAQFIQGEEEILGEAHTTIKGPGRHSVDFANVDNRLFLAVDGKPAYFLGRDSGEGFAYDQADEITPIPTEADLSPAGIAVRNASVGVSDLVLKRDIYYTQQPGQDDYSYSSVWDRRKPRSPVELFDFLADPSQFPRLAGVGTKEYPIGLDRYLMLGDNSPRSKDSRGWDTADAAWDPENRQAWEVPRNLVTGKAFYIYWPHGVPIGPIPFLFRPYFERMKWIR